MSTVQRRLGIGASLVLDELALIIRLQDVYWSPDGQLSVQVVSLVIALLGVALLGLNPVTAGVGLSAGHVALLVAFPLHLAASSCAYARASTPPRRWARSSHRWRGSARPGSRVLGRRGRPGTARKGRAGRRRERRRSTRASADGGWISPISSPAGPPAADGGACRGVRAGAPQPASLTVAELTFDDMDALQAGLGSQEGQAATNDIPNFATGGVTLFIAELD